MTRPCHLDTSPRVFVIWISRDWTPRSNCDQFPHIYHVSQSIMSARIGLDLWHVPQQLHDFQNSILISSGKFWIHRSMQCYQVRSLRVYTPHKNTHYPRYIKVVCFVRKSDKTRFPYLEERTRIWGCRAKMQWIMGNGLWNFVRILLSLSPTVASVGPPAIFLKHWRKEWWA